MSKTINIFDEKLVMKEPVIPIYRGASSAAKMIAQPTAALPGGSVPSQITFNLPLVPSNYFPRYPLLHNKWQYNLTCTNSTGAQINTGVQIVVPGVDVSLAEYPFLTNALGICEVTINGKSMGAVNMPKIAKKLLTIGEVKNNVKYATCPSAPELFASVDDANLTLGNSQATFNDASWDYVPNGAYPSLTFSTLNASGNIADAGTQVITVTCETWEPLVGLTPFVWDSQKDDAYSLFAMNNLMVNLNIQPNANKCARALRALSKSVLNQTAGGVTFAVSGITAITQCELHYFLLRPPASLSYKVPRESILHTYQYYWNSYKSPVAFATGNSEIIANPINFANYVSTGMPSLMMIWCNNDGNVALNLNDYNYPITHLDFQLGGTQNILAQYNQYDLYNLSKDAGLQSTLLNFLGQAYGVSYSAAGAPSFPTSFKSLVSGAVVLRPGISFPLPPDIATNSSGSYTFNFNVNCQSSNLKNAAGAFVDLGINPVVNVLCIYDAYVSINTDDLKCDIQRCTLMPRDVLDVRGVESVVERDVSNEHNQPLTEISEPDFKGAGLKGKLHSRIKGHKHTGHHNMY